MTVVTLKKLSFQGRLVTLEDLKGGITVHVKKISVNQLRSAV